MKRTLALAVGVVLLAAGIALAAEIVHVTLREATVRSGPKHFKPPVAVLRYGDRVEVLEEKDGWLRLKNGWLHRSAVSEEPVPAAPPAGADAAPGSVSRDEVALAGKGFNPQVEDRYRRQNPNLEDEFRKVDAMERRDVSREELDAFLREGRLGS